MIRRNPASRYLLDIDSWDIVSNLTASVASHGKSPLFKHRCPLGKTT
jgi:hypothetical protein